MPRLKILKKLEGVALSLEELCQHDDICTDILIDRTFYHTTVRKCKLKYTPLRGIEDGYIAGIIRALVAGRETVVTSEMKIIEIPRVQKYLDKLDTTVEKKRFRAQMRMYLEPYLHDCPWEVSSTNRFEISSYESSVVARTSISVGAIPYLRGSTVQLTKLEDAQADAAGHGLSVLASAKSRAAFVMLGPARFVNHDCTPNAELRPTDTGMEVHALRPIGLGEEIVVYYGGSYFGENNKECLCATCENLHRHGWQSRSSSPAPVIPNLSYSDARRIPREYLAMRRTLAGHRSCTSGTREPGDYVFTKKVLAHPYDRWVRCGNVVCKRVFVQQDGHLLRSECPRCERHRKIYDNRWPRIDINEEHDHKPQQFHTDLVPTAEAKLITRRGLYMEAELARIRGRAVDDSFEGDAHDRRCSKRLKRRLC